jgi:sugar lactone lactonase YvrE
MASRHLYSIDAGLLSDPAKSDADLSAAVVDHGIKGAGDGMANDDKGRVYASDEQRNQILRREPDGRFDTLVQDPALDWIDTVTVAGDGYLYFTVNQLDRQVMFNRCQDLRQKPYLIYRTPVDAKPAR